MSDVAARVAKLRPRLGEVVIVDLADEASDPELQALGAELGEISARTKATVLLLPKGVSLDVLDEREMLARGWIRVGPLAHTTEQLTSPPTETTEHLPSP